MARRSAVEKWLAELTHLPTAAGKEDRVVDWVRRWVSRRGDLRMTQDSGGNVIISQRGRKRRKPVLAVAHMDHPAFVITDVDGREAAFEFRGGVRKEYFDRARVEVVSRGDGGSGTVTHYEAELALGILQIVGDVRPGDIAMWKMRKPRSRRDIFAAPGCDDLAGCAAALAALDRARGKPELRHLGVMLTRAEEVGLVGALHAARHQTIPTNTRVLSIETSRAIPNASVGAGPVIRTGDKTNVFDAELTNLIGRVAAASGIRHQRQLMDGGTCEATAFGVYGYQTTGLCVPLDNYHNQGKLDDVEISRADPLAMYEEISLSDFHGLVDLLLVAVSAADTEDPILGRLDRLYEFRKNLLS